MAEYVFSRACRRLPSQQENKRRKEKLPITAQQAANFFALLLSMVECITVPALEAKEGWKPAQGAT